MGLESFEFNPQYFWEVVFEFYETHFSRFEPKEGGQDFKYKFRMMLANIIDMKISKRAGITIKDFEVRRSLNLLSECSKNFTKAKMQTALRAKFASVLFCTIRLLGWIDAFLKVD